MLGKLFRRYQDGYIYEVIGQIEFAGSPRWILWNERVAERITVTTVELQRQVGWELVGSLKVSTPEETAVREVPAALMK
jgi:hypothetical protein